MKNKNLFLSVLLVSVVLVLGLIQVSAVNGAQGQNPELTQGNQGVRMNVISGQYNNHLGQRMNIDVQENKVRLQVGEYGVDCEGCDLEKELVLDKLKIHATLSNGKNSEIKVMPDVASERALERLRLKNCNESNNCTMELKEVGMGDEARMAYQVKATKEAKVFGIFKADMDVETEIDAETGEVINTKRPWWSFLSTEEDLTEEI